MSFTWGLDLSNNDMVIGSTGKLLIVSGSEEVRQRILVALQHHWQEYFLNVPGGVPWYDYILGSKNRKLAIALIRRAILEVPGVISVVSLKIVFPSATTPRQVELYTNVEVIGQSGPAIVDLKKNLEL